jgi:hypothetical protein
MESRRHALEEPVAVVVAAQGGRARVLEDPRPDFEGAFGHEVIPRSVDFQRGSRTRPFDRLEA